MLKATLPAKDQPLVISKEIEEGRLQITPLPTGCLFVQQHARGRLETLSIGDYGKAANVTARFLGLDDEVAGVPNGQCKPLSEKWVVTLSTQYGCPMECTFCDVPNIEFQGNATIEDLRRQFNTAVLLFSEQVGLRTEVIHPVFTTSLPARLKPLEGRVLDWCEIKNDIYNGQAGLQFSINSTDDAERDAMFRGRSLSLREISELAKKMPPPIGRKYCLNFALASDFTVDAGYLAKLFDPAYFMVKITPIHHSNACRQNGIVTVGGYSSFAPYRKVEQKLRDHGFDVLVFVPSNDEESGLVTCGNSVLGGGVSRLSNDVINIAGLKPTELSWADKTSCK